MSFSKRSSAERPRGCWWHTHLSISQKLFNDLYYFPCYASVLHSLNFWHSSVLFSSSMKSALNSFNMSAWNLRFVALHHERKHAHVRINERRVTDEEEREIKQSRNKAQFSYWIRKWERERGMDGWILQKHNVFYPVIVRARARVVNYVVIGRRGRGREVCYTMKTAVLI